MTFVSRFPTLIVLLLFVVATVAPSAAAEPMREKKAEFYKTSLFGDLGYVVAATKSAAEGALFINSLAQSPCFSIDRARTWFFINHRDPERVGLPGFFAAKIVGWRTGSAQPERKLQLYRNANWVSDADRSTTLSEYYFPSTFEPEDAFTAFAEMHGMDTKAARLALLKKREEQSDQLGVWHATVRKGPSSWPFRLSFGWDRGLQNRFADKDTLLSERLLGFQITDATNSSNPVDFFIDPVIDNSEGYLVKVFASVPGVPERIVEVRVGTACP
jgi:hypothetical protein